MMKQVLFCSLWPQYVKQRIQDTYLYFGGSIAISAASAIAVFRTPALLARIASGGWLSILGTFAIVSKIFTNYITLKLQY